jgi:hypothetical protein
VPDDLEVEITPQFQDLFDRLPDDRHRDEVLGTLKAVRRRWCKLTPRYRSVHSYEWLDVLNPPLRMLLCVGVISGRTRVVPVDVFTIRSADDQTPQGRLEIADLRCQAEGF